MLRSNSHSAGYQDLYDQQELYITTEENSLDENFRAYFYSIFKSKSQSTATIVRVNNPWGETKLDYGDSYDWYGIHNNLPIYLIVIQMALIN